MKSHLHIIILSLVALNCSIAQTAKFAPFEGTIYDLYDYDVWKGFLPGVLTFDVLGKTTLPELNIKRNVKYFPGVYQHDGYGIMFTSTLTVDKEGCYDFLLESDDGSILWIEDQIIINNDSMHSMRAIRDTLSMKAGSYPVKVWFYNGATQWHGLILKVNKVTDSIPCPIKKRRFVLNDILFDFNSHALLPEGQAAMDQFCRLLKAMDINKIQLVGHTDNTGTPEYNKALSLRRAQAVMNYIRSKLNPDIVIVAEGKGNVSPVTNDIDPEAQKRNRRVEVFCE